MTAVIRWLPSSLVPLPSGTLPPELVINFGGIWVLVAVAFAILCVALWIAVRVNLHTKHSPKRRPRVRRPVPLPQRA